MLVETVSERRLPHSPPLVFAGMAAARPATGRNFPLPPSRAKGIGGDCAGNVGQGRLSGLGGGGLIRA